MPNIRINPYRRDVYHNLVPELRPALPKYILVTQIATPVYQVCKPSVCRNIHIHRHTHTQFALLFPGHFAPK